MNKEIITKDLTMLSEALDDIGFETKLDMDNYDIPTLVGIFPLDDEIEEVLTINYIELPKENLQFSKILNISSIINMDISSVHAAEIIMLLNEFNLLTAFGNFCYKYDNKPLVIMKCAIPMDIDNPPNDAVFCETVLNMLHYCQMLEFFIARMIKGESIKNIIVEIQKSLKN